MADIRNRTGIVRGTIAVCTLAAVWSASPKAQQPGEWLCDNSYQDCRTPIISAINNEPVTGGIDVSFWFMNDYRYVDAVLGAKRRGVPIRVLLDPRANDSYSSNEAQCERLEAGGIAIRAYAGPAINHWKAFIFAGQRKLNFSAGNFSSGSYSP